MSAHSQRVFCRRSASTSHMQIGSKSSVNKCGRARKCMDEAPTASSVVNAATNRVGAPPQRVTQNHGGKQRDHHSRYQHDRFEPADPER